MLDAWDRVMTRIWSIQVLGYSMNRVQFMAGATDWWGRQAKKQVIMMC